MIECDRCGKELAVETEGQVRPVPDLCDACWRDAHGLPPHEEDDEVKEPTDLWLPTDPDTYIRLPEDEK